MLHRPGETAAPPHLGHIASLTNLVDQAFYLAITSGTETITKDRLADTIADNAAHTSTRAG